MIFPLVSQLFKMSKQLHFIVLFLFCSCHLAYSQEIKQEKDSARLYKNIEKFSKKNKFTKFVHGLIFEPIKVKKKITKKRKTIVPKKIYSAFEGKIIRDINIVTLDPFGYSESDPDVAPVNYISRAGNAIHIKSRKLNIKNLLLIKRNKPLDSLLVKESVRLVRSQRYVRAVIIKPELIAGNPDSVDVNIRVLDAWSLLPDIAGSGNSVNLKIKERNFIGLGHQFDNAYEREFDTGNFGYSTRYFIPNILNTYITAAVGYQIDLERNYGKYANVERPFFSPFAKWAGGAYIDQQFYSDSIPDAMALLQRQNFKYNSQDFWGGYSYQLFRGNTENDRTTNIVMTGRFLNVDYIERPTIAFDSVNFYNDEKLYLVGIGLSSRQYVEDKYIFNYGVVEDVPVGRVFAITGGWQDKNRVGRLYAGARVSLGKFYKWGYLSSNFEYGTYFNKGTLEREAITAHANYFTNLMESGKWKFRQFIKTRLVLGNNRERSRGDFLTLDEQNGIPGFTNTGLFGTKKAFITFQSQAYSPGTLAGFHLNPYFSYSIGMLGQKNTGFKNSRAYSQIGVGVIVSNDYLVFSNFQISFSYYPNIPGSGDNIFKTNAINTEDFGFLNFEILKPRPANYQ